ncbi:hypothetical protein [Rhodoflexus sp.]
MKKYLLVALVGMMSLGMVACGGKKPAEEQSQTTVEEVAVSLEWKIEALGMDETETAPITRFAVLINGKEISLGEVRQPLAEIPASKFINNGIPEDAVIACGGYWGGTTNYYAVVKGNEVVIMSGGPKEDYDPADEQQSPYYYEVFKTIPLP